MKCDLCGAVHGPHQAHQFKREVVNSPVVVNTKPVMVVNRSRDRHKDKDKRRTYMREYMRTARAR